MFFTLIGFTDIQLKQAWGKPQYAIV